MKLIILGSGGCQAIPRPLCYCKNCEKARSKGIPYAHTGPSLYLENEAILFDTPEETRIQIERENIQSLKHVFYTHWHPDHTQGLRIFEQIQSVYPEEKRLDPIKVYIPENAYAEFMERLEPLRYFEKMGFITIIKTNDRTPVRIGTVTITPVDFKRNDRVRYGYLIEKDSKRVIYAPCSIFDWKVDKYYDNLDLLIMEKGWDGKTEFRKTLPKEHYWHDHASFEENILEIKKIKPKKVVITHIDGARHKTIDGDYDLLVAEVKKYSDLNIEVAYDGMKIEI